MNVLIVDDSRAMRMIVGRTLKQAGFSGLNITEAENGLEAFEKIQQEVPDVVLSDWNMPTMTGIELLQKLVDSNIKVPFGFVTSESSADTHRQASELGSSFFITKPFTPEKFEHALAPIFETSDA